MKDFSELEDKLGIKFKNKDLLTQAFVHRSFLNENPDFGLRHNERLEFLGDAVLELVVTKYLFKKYPQKLEGELTSWRAALVNSHQLSEIAEEVGLNDFLLLSKGEEKDESKARKFILANTFEAFVGALYLDSGYDVAADFIEKYLIKEIPRIAKEKLFKDSKSHFQEKAQEIIGVTPTYKVLKEEGPDHNKKFIVGVYLGKNLIAEGKGTSKQEGELDAASNALEIKNWKRI